MSLNCEYCAIPGYYGEIFYETEYWIVFLAPSQRYLGTCVVALRRQCKDLLELNAQEWADFGNIVQKLENALNHALNPTLFNWSCFKNATFRLENPQPEIHWHFIPRYKHPVEFQGISFEVMGKLRELIKKNLE
jgi:diadenosine tetraphosphate (Ap4A) HIT family hydrolase